MAFNMQSIPISKQPGIPTTLQDEPAEKWVTFPDKVIGFIAPGLECLSELCKFKIQQDILNDTDYSPFPGTGRKFKITNGNGDLLYIAYEESDLSHKKDARSGILREYKIHLVDFNRKEVIRVVHPNQCCPYTCWCCPCLGGCTYLVDFEAPPGRLIGKMQARPACVCVQTGPSRWQGVCRSHSYIMDASGQKLVHSRGQHFFPLDDSSEPVLRYTEYSETSVAGAFSRDLDVKLKATLLCASILGTMNRVEQMG